MNFKDHASEIEKFLEPGREPAGVKILKSYSSGIYRCERCPRPFQAANLIGGRFLRIINAGKIRR
ncbi:MAG: hypothetical protein A7315_08880 [Candidatus Altiarchaeales archaeon WOR_SM1_79]|nr:MAG: hypothetical protein A7315_08880 [Candidatus Altiarchaeales archaeon WOR_SM1_79]